MRFIFGTGNQAKLRAMKETLLPLSIEIDGLYSVCKTIPEVNENGNDPLENAVIKATAYYNAVHAPVFSCDSGLYIDELEDTLQPGVHIRNINGKRLSDDEMISYYSGIAKKCGGLCHGIYRNAICFIYDDKHIYKYSGNDLSGKPFIISSKPHQKRNAGFPLDSLSIQIDTGKYYYDLEEEIVASMASGFQNFFKRVLGDLKLA